MFQILNPLKAGSEFQKLKSRRKWILAVTIALIPTLLSTVGRYLVQQENQAVMQQLMEERSAAEGQPPREREVRTSVRILPFGMFQGGGSMSSTGMMVLGIILGTGFAVIFWVLKSAVFHLGSKVLGGEKVNISSTIHVIAYTYIPFVFKGILDVVKGVIYQAPTSMEGLMFQTRSTSAVLNFIGNHLTIFVVWALFLMIIAVREQFSLSNKKALCLVLIPYIAAWILQLTILSTIGFMRVI